MSNILFIPNTIKVGYQKRTDTYTNKLAYVIYYDEKNKLRKEKSWTGWCDPKLGNNDYSNEPIEGFILNRNGGGTRDYYYWNARAEFVRVWDPRGFEFEISIPNLLFILSEVGSSPGKGLEGKFVYGWNGAELVLLPVGSQDYKKSMEFTNKQSVKIDRKTMVVGGTYTLKKDKQSTEYIYMGKLNYLDNDYRKIADCGVKDVFAYKYGNQYKFVTKSISDLGECLNNHCIDTYAELLDEYNDSIHSIVIEKIETVLVGPGLSEKYFSRIEDFSKISTDKKYNNYSNLYFKYRKNPNYYYNYNELYSSYNTFIIDNKKIDAKYSAFRNLSIDQKQLKDNVNHYRIFIYADGLKIEFNENMVTTISKYKNKSALKTIAIKD